MTGRHRHSTGRYRWIVCALLFAGIFIVYTDRQTLSLVKALLDERLKWTDEQYGWINAAFLVAYGLSTVAFGWFIDRVGTKVGYIVAIGAWSISTVCTAGVGSVRGFLVARFAVGASEGGCFPTSIKAIALWFPRSERALATTLFISGVNVSAIAAPAAIPWIALHWGWQGAYVAVGAAGIIWLAGWLLLYNRPERIARLNQEERAHILGDRDEGTDDSKRLPWPALLGLRRSWSYILGRFLTDPIWWFFLVWLPDFFKKTRGLDMRHSWPHMACLYGIVTVLSICGGWQTGRLMRRGWSVTRARKTAMFISALCVMPILAVSHVGDWMAVLLIGLAAAAHQVWSANLFTTVSDMFPNPAVASVIGLGGLSGALGSALFQPFAGGLLDFFKVHGGPAVGYNILFTICGCIYLPAFLINHFCAPSFVRITPNAQ